jgi:hypothetical protein
MAKAMTDATQDDDDYEEEDYGPSLAYPPLYVLRSAERCPECDRALHVYTLGCTAYRDAEDGGEPIKQFHFLQRIESIPQPLMALLKTKLPGYYPDHTEEREPPYLMNHCPCGGKLDDGLLHGDVGAAFWPDTPEGFAAFRLLKLPMQKPIPVVCSYSIGGGEYLNFANTWKW